MKPLPASDGWLDDRLPPVPAPFRPWLEGSCPPEDVLRAGASIEVSVHAMIESAMRQIELSLQGRGEHSGAVALLAADAWITYAAERALDGEDPEARLMAMAQTLAASTSPDRGVE